MATFIELHFDTTEPGVHINFDLVQLYTPNTSNIDGWTSIRYADGSTCVVFESVKTIYEKIQQARILHVHNYPSKT